MEIIFKSKKEKSNFSYCADIFKGKKKLNGFNKMVESLCERVSDDEYSVRDVSFNEDLTGTLYLCYPLSVVVKEEIHFNSLHTLISEIRRVYQKIYEDPITYGVWGHSIYDLVIESITIYEGNLVDVSIGS